jgi:hypothetical protein
VQETVKVTLADHSFTPADVTVPAGVVTFEVENKGPDDEGAPDEEALATAGAFELESFDAGLVRGTLVVT